MSALNGKNLKFYTLPISGYADVNLNGSMQDVNDIDVSYIQQVVNKAFNPPPVTPSGKTTVKKKAAPIPAASTVTADVYNGGSTAGLAGSVSQALVSLGYKAGTVADASAQSQTPVTGTEVFYGAGASANAAKIATDFGTTAKPLSSLPAQRVEVLLGTGSTVVPAGLHPDVNVNPRAVLVLVGVDGRQRGGRRRGDGRGQRQVRNTLRILTTTLCSRRREERRC